MTEKEIQYAIYRRYCLIDKSMIAMVPNCYTLLENECDVFGVTRSLVTHEFEIKVSRADFIADAKKKVRFKTEKGYSEWMLKSDAYRLGLMPTNHFWYVAPVGLLEKSDIPPHAGFLQVHSDGMISTSIVAPKMKKVKMPEKDIIFHLAKNSKKYWSTVSL